MSSVRKKRQARDQRRAANLFAFKAASCTPPPLPPAQRDEITPEIEALLGTTKNVKDVPLPMLQIHACHGDRNPYNDTPEGQLRRLRCEAHIRDAGGWDAFACEVLTVSVHKDGSYWIIDGVGRLYMADALSGGLVETLPCRLLSGLTLKQEHALFKRLGTQRTKVSPYDVWHDSGAEDVKPISAIKARFGYNMPRVHLPTLRFSYEQRSAKTDQPVLEQTLAIVAGTSLSANRKYTTAMTGAVASIIASQPNFDEARFRSVLPDDPEFSYRLFLKAQRAANRLGYAKPHIRTVTWQAAILLIDEYYNPNLGRDRKLTSGGLDTIKTAFNDAYSAADPAVASKPRLKVVAA